MGHSAGTVNIPGVVLVYSRSFYTCLRSHGLNYLLTRTSVGVQGLKPKSFTTVKRTNQVKSCSSVLVSDL